VEKCEEKDCTITMNPEGVDANGIGFTYMIDKKPCKKKRTIWAR
jgi:hypothetical protein